jgi:Tol biopolymer transport system component
VAAAAIGCQTDAPNPFTQVRTSATPAPSAALLFVSNRDSAATEGLAHEVYAVDAQGASVQRLTTCNREGHRCEVVECAPSSSDRSRVVIREITADSDGDGRITPLDAAALVFLNLERSAEATLAPASQKVTGIDWSPASDAEILAFSATGSGGTDDLYRSDSNGQNIRNLTMTTDVSERRPRIDPSGSVAVYERSTTNNPKSEIWIFFSGVNQIRVTSGADTAGSPLPGTPYVIGSDANPVFSPDGRAIVFRRLTGLGNGKGTWDLMIVNNDGTGLQAIASGPVYRGAPDWGSQGIVFAEASATGAGLSLVLMQPDGSGRRTLVSVPAGRDLDLPRWLH